MHRGKVSICCCSEGTWERYENMNWVWRLSVRKEFFQRCVDKYSCSSQHLTTSLFCKRHIEKMEMPAVGIFISCKQLWNFKRNLTAAWFLPNWFIISVFSVAFRGKWHKVLYSPRCQPLTRLGGTFTSFTGLPGNEVEESVSLWPAGRHSPLVSQTKCNRQSQDMKGDCCSQTDVTSAGGQANNRTCLWKYQNITCHGVSWLLSKRGTCSGLWFSIWLSTLFFLHLKPSPRPLSCHFYENLWIKQDIHITYTSDDVQSIHTDAF